MREIDCGEITRTVAALCIKAATVLTPDIAMAIELASEKEPSEAGRAALEDIMENFKYAAKNTLPICQDTGIAVVFAEIGQDVHITGGLFEDAVNEGVRKGYAEGFLRMSVLDDPFRKKNTGDNTPPVIHTRITGGDRIRLIVSPKGFGSENMSAMKMMLPTATRQDVIDFITDTVSRAGANPCPPVVVGVGVGGTVERAALLAKQSLVRPLDRRNPDPDYADMERRALAAINALGIGPQGFGGRTTALAVNITGAPSHIAGFPCVVNIGCHATRHAECII